MSIRDSLMASSSASAPAAALLIGVYTLGFVLPFLAVGLFTGGVLSFFKRHQQVVRWTGKAGAALLILMGVMTFTGFMNGFTEYLSQTCLLYTSVPHRSGGIRLGHERGGYGGGHRLRPEGPPAGPLFPGHGGLCGQCPGQRHPVRGQRRRKMCIRDSINNSAPFCGLSYFDYDMPKMACQYEVCKWRRFQRGFRN